MRRYEAWEDWRNNEESLIAQDRRDWEALKMEGECGNGETMDMVEEHAYRKANDSFMRLPDDFIDGTNCRVSDFR